MTDWSAAQRDRVLALLAGALATAFIIGARGIEDSLLSDSVGAGGVPQGVGIAMGVAALALFVKSLLEQPRAGAAAAAAQAPAGAPAPTATAATVATPVLAAAADAGTEPRGDLSRNSFVLRTVGLVLLLCGYAVLLPLAGYMLSIMLLVLAVGWLAGAAFRPPLFLTAALAGPLLWGLFGYLLQVRMPMGSWWG